MIETLRRRDFYQHERCRFEDQLNVARERSVQRSNTPRRKARTQSGSALLLTLGTQFSEMWLRSAVELRIKAR